MGPGGAAGRHAHHAVQLVWALDGDFSITLDQPVRRRATIIPVKVLGNGGFGWSSVVARGITYIADLKAGPLAGHPVVINMSLGGPELDAVEQAAIDYAISKGVIIVAAAGNEAEAGMSYPGAYRPVISAGSFGWVGGALAIGGAIAGNAPATYTGVGLAAANPTYEKTRMRRTGSVGMDLKIVDPTNGRLAGTANVAGTFTSEAATGGFSLFGVGGSETAYAASALGQAQRVAMNDAVQKINQRLAIAAR